MLKSFTKATPSPTPLSPGLIKARPIGTFQSPPSIAQKLHKIIFSAIKCPDRPKVFLKEKKKSFVLL